MGDAQESVNAGRRENMKNGCVTVGDTEMYYVSFGKGNKKLVALPGLSSETLGLMAKSLSVRQLDELKTAFEAAHSLKGFLGNLGLTPLYEAAVELTELLRNPIGDVDYDLPLAKLTKLYDEFTAMCKT